MMRNIVLSHLLLPLFASLAFSATAAPAATPVDPAPVVAAGLATATEPAKLNLNNADAATLQKALNGIGKTKAEAIVQYRETHGPFASVDELLEIPGIGSALLERNRERLTVE